MSGIRRVVLVLLALGLTAGAVYSYDQVRFGDRAVVFFRTVLAGEDGFRNLRGRGDPNRRRPESAADSARLREFRADSARFGSFVGDSTGRRSSPGDSTGRSASAIRDRRRRPPGDDGEMREMRSQRDREGRDFRGRGRGRGSAVSFEDVGYYTVIVSFVTMLTAVGEGLAKTARRARRRQ